MKTTSIRASLLRNFLLLIVSVSVIILITQTLSARKTVKDLSQRLIAQSADRAEGAMRHYFESIESMLATSQSWWAAGPLTYTTPTDLDDLNATFVPLLTQHPHVTSVMIAQDDGFGYLLHRDVRGGDQYHWYNRIVLPDEASEDGYEALWTRDLTLYRKGDLPEHARDYDPRNRPFYQEPKLETVYWTDPYYFFTAGDAGVTAAFKWKDDQTGQPRLVAFDLLLADLSQFTSHLHPSPNGRVFVMHPDGSILGLPADERWRDVSSVRKVLHRQTKNSTSSQLASQRVHLRTAKDLDLPAIHLAVESWKKRDAGEATLFQFMNEEKSWWAGFRPFSLHNQRLMIGVIIPENDFMHDAIQQRNIVLLVCFGAILAAIGMTHLLARRYSRPLESLAEQSARIRELNLHKKISVTSPIQEVSQLADAQSQMIAALDSFSRYVPLELVRELVRRGEVAKIGGKTANLTILFTDIKGFTSLAEKIPPDTLTTHMAEYFSVMLDILHAEHATVDKFVGDAIVAFWGAPNHNPDHALHAVRAVLHCVDTLKDRNSEWEKRGLPPLPTRFGLCTGDAVVGNMGAPTRLNYTVLGDTVNIASRLEALNEQYETEILASESVVHAAGPFFSWRKIDHVVVRGKVESFTIYEPLGPANAISESTLRRARGYEEALQLFSEGNFAQASQILRRLLKEFRSDGAAFRLQDRCLQYQNTPPIFPWDGITRYDTK